MWNSFLPDVDRSCTYKDDNIIPFQIPIRSIAAAGGGSRRRLNWKANKKEAKDCEPDITICAKLAGTQLEVE